MSTPRLVRGLGHAVLAFAVAAGLGIVAGAGAVAVGPAAVANAATAGAPITRSEILARAQTLVDQRPTYTQETCWNSVTQSVTAKPCLGESYRRDCSGLVADAWHLPTLHLRVAATTNSPVTDDFQDAVKNGDDANHPWKPVPGGIRGFLPGDAMVRDGHIELFAFWKNPNRPEDGAYVYSWNHQAQDGKPGEQVENPYAPTPVWNLWGFNGWGDLNTFDPIRYNNVVDDAASGQQVSAVYNPVAQAVEVYYNAGGVLMEKYWDSTGWHGPVNLGAAITGAPVAVHNPSGNSMEVYFNSGGSLVEKFWTAQGWSNVVPLAGGVVGAPGVVYNPVAQAMEVYYNAGGTLTEKFWNSTGWHGPVGLGAAITGSPVAVHNPLGNSLEVYFNSGGSLVEKFWTAQGWSNVVPLAGGMIGAPSPVYDPLGNAMEIYYNAGGVLTEKYWTTTAWSGPINLGVTIS
jgi:YD repeat-containing protein